MKPRKARRAASSGRSRRGTLQGGRGSETAESSLAIWGAFDQDHLQGGRGSETAESSRDWLVGGGEFLAFNEAAAVKPRKEYRVYRQFEGVYLLQGGRGGETAESFFIAQTAENPNPALQGGRGGETAESQTR